jgi:hypothetical protein
MLHEKIERVLEIIFPRYGLKVKRPGEGAGDDGESDDSVIWEELDEKNTLYNYY